MLHVTQQRVCGAKLYDSNLFILLVVTLFAFLSSAPLGLVKASAINATHANGLIAYSELNVQTPRYREWNRSHNFTLELTNALAVTGDITWVVVRANHERDEVMVGTLDKELDVNVQVYHGQNTSWHNLLEVSTDVQNSAYRAFDIAYEDVSGDALVVYETSKSVDNIIGYRIWNGTAYSQEINLTVGFTDTTTITRWIQLLPKRGEDTIMLLVHNSVGDLYAIEWNGTHFDSAKELEASVATTSNAEEHFMFAWEEDSGAGLLGYGESSSFVYREYSPTSPHWGSETAISLGNGLDAVRFCSDPTSDYIGIILEDAGNDLHAYMWNGTDVLASPPTMDDTIEANGANSANIDCAWDILGTYALFGFIDSHLLSMDYFNFTKPNTWSTSDLTSTGNTGDFATDDIAALRFAEHPSTDEIMIVAIDIAEDISSLHWNGSGFKNISASPIEQNTEIANGGQEGAMFDWHRYDTAPTVTSLHPSDLTYTPDTVVSINATVIDNIAISTVLVQVTLPNGTVEELPMEDTSSDSSYNATFTSTSATGTYTFTIIANDTSTHQNVNATETSNFSISDPDNTNPVVIALAPTLGDTFNVSTNITIQANVTDNNAIAVVIAELLFPNETITTVSLENVDSSPDFNTTFIIPNLTGVYNITFIANDTSANSNNTEITFFSGNDQISPVVSNVRPTSGTTFNISTTITVGINVTDHIGVADAFAELVLPNGSTTTLSLSNTSGLPDFNTTFLIPNLTGEYNVTFVANDTGGNINNSQTTFFVGGDFINPAVTPDAPQSNSSFNASDTIVIGVNVTDSSQIDTVLAEVLFPNSTIRTLTLVNQSGSVYFNTTFTVPNVTGTYNITFTVNDSAGNINNTETIFFTCIDSQLPLLLSTVVTPISVINGSRVFLDASATDNVALDSVFVDITLPNGTQVLLTQLPTNYTADTTPLGIYNVTFYANDSSGNTQNTTTNFTSYEPTVHTITTLDKSSNPSEVEMTIFTAGTTSEINSSQANGSLTMTVPNTLVDIQMNTSFATQELVTTLFGTNLSENTNRTIFLSNPNLSDFVVSYAIETDYTFSIAQVMVSYVNASFSNESALLLHKCDDFNITTEACSSGFNEVTNNETTAHDPLNDRFFINTTSFSAFAITEGALISSSSASTSAPSTSSIVESSSDGGGSGGGIPSMDTYLRDSLLLEEEYLLEALDAMGEEDSSLDVSIEILSPDILLGEHLAAIISLDNGENHHKTDVTLFYTITHQKNGIVHKEDETIELQTEMEFVKTFSFPNGVEDGEYTLLVEAEYPGQKATCASEALFSLAREAKKPSHQVAVSSTPFTSLFYFLLLFFVVSLFSTSLYYVYPNGHERKHLLKKYFFVNTFFSSFMEHFSRLHRYVALSITRWFYSPLFFSYIRYVLNRCHVNWKLGRVYYYKRKEKALIHTIITDKNVIRSLQENIRYIKKKEKEIESLPFLLYLKEKKAWKLRNLQKKEKQLRALKSEIRNIKRNVRKKLISRIFPYILLL